MWQKRSTQLKRDINYYCNHIFRTLFLGDKTEMYTASEEKGPYLFPSNRNNVSGIIKVLLT